MPHSADAHADVLHAAERRHVLHAVHAMGTRFEFVLPARNAAAEFLRGAAEAAADEVLLWHHRLSAFTADSDLARLRRAAPSPVPLPPETLAVLARCVELCHVTEGRFDPTLAPVLQALGLRDVEPDLAQLDRARAFTGPRVLELSATHARLAKSGCALDLGAVGKGIALDAAACVLQSLGQNHALLHGGTSSALGLGTDEGQPWRVRLGPEANDPVVELADLSLGVSAHHGRCGPLGGHVIDPRSLRSAFARARAAAVVCESAFDADAWSTALLVDPDMASRLPGAMSAFIQWPDGSWQVQDGLGVCVSAAQVASAVGASS